jgi:hypothetical protein
MVPTPYCKVCHDSGKDESIYTSHFIRETRDANSKIVCPTLLSLECRYCSKPGHTVKYCKEIKKISQGKITHVPKKCIPLPLPNNLFCVLDSDNEEQEDDDLPDLLPYDLPPLVPYDLPPLVSIAPTFDTEMPPLVPIAPVNTHVTNVLSYKNIIQITREQVLKEEKEKWELERKKEEEHQRRELARKLEENKRLVEAFKNAPKIVFKPLNWADDSSDEE